MTEGPKYGYYLKPSKSFFFVKQHYKEYGERVFAGSNIKITEGTRHLGAVFGDTNFKKRISPKRNTVIEKSVGNIFKGSRGSTKNCLFSIYVWI